MSVLSVVRNGADSKDGRVNEEDEEEAKQLKIAIELSMKSEERCSRKRKRKLFEAEDNEKDAIISSLQEQVARLESGIKTHHRFLLTSADRLTLTGVIVPASAVFSSSSSSSSSGITSDNATTTSFGENRDPEAKIDTPKDDDSIVTTTTTKLYRCPICENEPPSGFFEPCCHSSYCFRCAVQWAERSNTCPSCGGTIFEVRRLFS